MQRNSNAHAIALTSKTPHFLPLTSSPVRLGFGCAELPAHSPRRAASMLACAYDHGVRHFDTAPLYQYGQSEKLLGDFGRGRRDQITIATKVGLDPQAWNARTRLKVAANAALRAFPGAVRTARRALALLRRNAEQAATAAQACKRFDVATARARLESSLRLLQTDYIDLWLLHEATAAEADDPALLDFLEQARAQGKIRSYGIGTVWPVLLRDVQAYPSAYRVLQFDCSVLEPAIDQVMGMRADVFRITHGAVRHVAECRRRLALVPPSIQARFSQDTGIDLGRAGEVAGLMLRWAINRNREGGVLFSSRVAGRIHSNVRAATDARFSPAVLDKFEDLVRSVADRR
jgi:D-threo-aldose 1-dehydrogenase